VNSVNTSSGSALTPRACAAFGVFIALAVACGEKVGATQSTETEASTGGASSSTQAMVTEASTDGASSSTMVTTGTGDDAGNTTGNPFCGRVPSTPCGDYIGALACCGVETLQDEAGAFWTEDCYEYAQTAPGECGALLNASLVCLTALPCEELLAFRADYKAGDAAWKTAACGEQVEAAIATDCADWWTVG